MTPDQITAFAAFLGLFFEMSGWPMGVILFIMIIGPWLLAMLLSYFQMRRFESVVKMYENNIELVKRYEDVANDLKEVVIMNTTALTRVKDRFYREG